MQIFSTLSDEDARIAIEAMRAELLRRGQSATIAVADASGEAIGVLRMDGAALNTFAVAVNKAFTAARLRRSTRITGRNVRNPETGFDISYYGDPRYVGWAGGLPVVVDDKVVGSVAISGLSEDEDEQVAAVGIAAVLGHIGQG